MRTITTARLILRPWEPDDVDFLLDLEGRWDVVRYLGADPSTLDSRDDALASIGRRRRISDHPIHGIWMMTDTGGVRLGNLLPRPVPLSAGRKQASRSRSRSDGTCTPARGAMDTPRRPPLRSSLTHLPGGSAASSPSLTPTMPRHGPFAAGSACATSARPRDTWTPTASSSRSNRQQSDMPRSVSRARQIETLKALAVSTIVDTWSTPPPPTTSTGGCAS